MGGGNEVCDGQLERGSCGGIIELDFAKYVIFFLFNHKAANDISNRVVS